ncbi:hypothetical protein L3C95_12985 [Chitinophaga filiformis]|uniref:hypothetical protein n=1 Tax=Chitinophaga filiformis TaxID=104663 RepID=UPI001F39A031|nr:hypothetical protein [Chitinophaga filiformis]MCF6403799.1 hypothetical protein [Chitinophaga filiformis]
MKAIPHQHSFRFHNLGIGDIQLGKKPEQIPGMLPFPSYTGKNNFRVYPDAAHYHAFNGTARGTIEKDDPGINLQHLLTGINEDGFINRIFLYPQEANEQLAWRLSQLYGEPFTGKVQSGVQNTWITESETEVTLFNPADNNTADTVISFRFFYDFSALKEYIIEGTT